MKHQTNKTTATPATTNQQRTGASATGTWNQTISNSRLGQGQTTGQTAARGQTLTGQTGQTIGTQGKNKQQVLNQGKKTKTGGHQ